MKYWRDEEYKDERGATVVVRTLYDTEDNKFVNIEFFGKGVTVFQTPMGEIPQEFDVPLEGVTNVIEAFESFEKQMSEKGPKVAEELFNQFRESMIEKEKEKSSRLVIPSNYPGP